MQTVSIDAPNEDLRATLDAAIDHLRGRRTEWARLPIPDKIALLDSLQKRLMAVADRWVEAASTAKGLLPGSPLRGEEWTTGPWALLYYLEPLRETLRHVHEGTFPELLRGRVRQRANGQTVVRLMPDGLYDRLLLSGFEVEVWMQPGVRPEDLPETMASFYRQENPEGSVTLVLGAGNAAFIPVKDVLYRLFAEGSVCILKLNPVNAYLGPLFEEVFADFVARGFVRFVYGGAEAGQYLAHHDSVDGVHLTGSATTHDALVYGTGEEGRRRKAADTPVLNKRLTSELGGVTPVIVVPGPWSDEDIRFQAEHVATMKLYNVGCNCIAAQVLVLPADWPLRDRFLQAVRDALDRAPDRPAYYPGASERVEAACRAHQTAVERLGPRGERVLLADLSPEDESAHAFDTEIFAGVLATTALPGGAPGDDPASYLRSVAAFCNARLAGTLSATILIHPRTLASLGDDLEDALEQFRYGTVGVNVWSAFAFLNPKASWGAFPGHKRADIGSGCGVVNNALLFERPERSVVRGPFAPFPRSLRAGEWHTSPIPVWFITNRTADVTTRRLAAFTAAPSPWKLPGILAAAVRG